MILISFIHITDSERNITCKYQVSCYNKYIVHRYSGNFGITNSTRATETINVNHFSQAV